MLPLEYLKHHFIGYLPYMGLFYCPKVFHEIILKTPSLLWPSVRKGYVYVSLVERHTYGRVTTYDAVYSVI